MNVYWLAISDMRPAFLSANAVAVSPDLYFDGFNETRDSVAFINYFVKGLITMSESFSFDMEEL